MKLNFLEWCNTLCLALHSVYQADVSLSEASEAKLHGVAWLARAVLKAYICNGITDSISCPRQPSGMRPQAGWRVTARACAMQNSIASAHEFLRTGGVSCLQGVVAEEALLVRGRDLEID